MFTYLTRPNPNRWFPFVLPTMLLVKPLRRLLGRPTAISYFHTTANSWASRKVIQKFNLADIGEGITECEVVKWCVPNQGPAGALRRT